MLAKPVLGMSLAALLAAGLVSPSLAAGLEVVSGPGVNPSCFAPFSAETKFLKFPKKEPPYRIALANGFVGNTWRIQMIKTLKAYAEQPDVAPMIEELKVVSTGTDVAAQVAAIDNFINAGYDAILTIAVNPTAFEPVIRRANRAGVVLVPFDNVLDTEAVIQVNEDQFEMGRIMGRWLVKNAGTSGKILEVRGLPGNSVDRDRHLGFREVLESSGQYDIVEVVGNWDDGTAQKVTADAIAVHGQFAGIYTQGGSTGTVRALMDAGHPFIPVAGEAENGFRKLCAQHAAEGLVCSSAGQSPGLVAIAAKTALTALQGEVLPQYVSVPIPLVEHPDFKAGENYYPDLGDNFFTPNEFPPCGVNITATEIMAKSEADQ
ncbi:MAG TPA: sugar ABC transporter substrate-binding protein [Kiloniellaceae bacterium]|nr:sugar ABC transporter substrate-binding protein [Kiloniellaceae bacterium]